MKIGVVYELLEGGGAPLVVKNQIRNLIERHHQVTFITTPQEVHRARVLFAEVRCVPLLGHPLSKLLGPLWPLVIIATLLLIGVETIIIHSMRTASYIGFFALLCGCRVIAVEHANPYIGSSGLSNRQRRFLNFVLKRSTVVCVSKGSAHAFKEVFGVESHVIYNFPSFEKRDSNSDVAKRDNAIVFLGRLVPQKGADIMLRCFERIAPYCMWTLEIYGRGCELDELQRNASHSKYCDRIRFHDWAHDPRSVLERCGIFVMPSRYEGFGIALVEAMSAGTPCVSFDCSFGPREIIEHGRSGILVKDGDVDELSEAILELIGNSKLRAELGIAAISRAVEFNVKRHNFAWDRLIAYDC
jgi:glycosyltransferase involved in cell wall biosynthesis